MKVKIKVAVCIDKKGYWNSSGWCFSGGQSEADNLNFAQEGLDFPYPVKVVWLEAEVDAPIEAEAIKATVNERTE